MVLLDGSDLVNIFPRDASIGVVETPWLVAKTN